MEPEIKLSIQWIIEKAKEFQKNIYFCFIDYAKAFDYVDHNRLENSSRDGNTRPPYLTPEKHVCRSRSNTTGHGAADWFQIGKGVCQSCIYNGYNLSKLWEDRVWHAAVHGVTKSSTRLSD